MDDDFLADETVALPSWFEQGDVSMTGIDTLAASMLTMTVPDDIASVTHPARRVVQSWVDANSALGLNPLLLHQLQPKPIRTAYHPMRAITMAALVLTMRRVPIERRVCIAAVLIADNFDIVEVPEQYRATGRGASAGPRTKASA